MNFRGLCIDRNKKIIFKEDQPLKVTSAEFKIINLFISQPERIFSKEQIYETAWGELSENCTHSVENMISRIRKKIEDDCKEPRYIVTVRGFGYKFKGKEN